MRETTLKKLHCAVSDQAMYYVNYSEVIIVQLYFLHLAHMAESRFEGTSRAQSSFIPSSIALLNKS